LVPGLPAVIRVGHKGAGALAPGNTLASFDAARAVGVDMIEFDVLSEHPDGSGELYVVHDHRELRRHAAPTLAQALAHLGTPPLRDLRLQVDLKRQGYEERTLASLANAGALPRTLITTGEWASLERVRALEPQVRLGWTVRSPLAGLPGVERLAGTLRGAVLARAAVERLRARAVDAIVPQWPLVSRRLVQAVTAAGGEIYVWTVDDARTIRRLRELGVTGVITNDPRLFALS
jgi:glycerophosphoryl diester phosphodiesterase